MNLRLVVIVGLVCVVAVSCKSGPGCDPAQLAGLERALKSVDPEQRMTMGMTGLGEACGAQLPSGISAALRVMGSADPATRATKVAQGMADSTSFCEAACPDFKQVFGKVSSVEASAKGKLVYEACGYQSLGLVTQGEFEASAERDFVGAFLVPPLYRWLVDHKVEQAEARGLMRQVLGL